MTPVPLGGKLDRLFGNYFVVCRNVNSDAPECFVLEPDEVRQLTHKGEKNGRTSYWLQPKQYETDEFRERWDRIDHNAPDSDSTESGSQTVASSKMSGLRPLKNAVRP